jgi:hypothetical protein
MNNRYITVRKHPNHKRYRCKKQNIITDKNNKLAHTFINNKKIKDVEKRNESLSNTINVLEVQLKHNTELIDFKSDCVIL